MAKRKKRVALLPPPPSPPIQPGLISPTLPVPPDIERPDYATTGTPSPRESRAVRTDDEIERMRVACAAAADVLNVIGDSIEPGVTTDEIDRIGHADYVRRGGYPSTLNYKGYPKSLCTSVNEVICHGIPDSRPLAEGDIVNVDVTIYLGGVHGDTSATFLVGDVDDDSLRLVDETRNALYAGIEAVRPGAPIYAIGRAIERHAKRYGLGVVREFIGHGIGDQFHTSLQIPHYYDPSYDTELEPGMTFTIEPMLTLGDPALVVWDDGWTAVTRDGQRSAQFEHTVLVTDRGVEVLTLPRDGLPAAERFRR